MNKIIYYLCFLLLNMNLSQAQDITDISDVPTIRSLLRTTGQDWQDNVNCKKVAFGDIGINKLSEILSEGNNPEVAAVAKKYYSTSDLSILNTLVSINCYSNSKPLYLNKVATNLLIETQIEIGKDLFKIFDSSTSRKSFFRSIFWCHQDLSAQKITIDDCITHFGKQLELSKENHQRLIQIAKESTLLYTEILNRNEFSCENVKQFRTFTETDKDYYFIAKVASYRFNPINNPDTYNSNTLCR
jgi:hypothetical protein